MFDDFNRAVRQNSAAKNRHDARVNFGVVACDFDFRQRKFHLDSCVEIRAGHVACGHVGRRTRRAHVAELFDGRVRLTDGVDDFGRDVPVNRFGVRVHLAAPETSRRSKIESVNR